MQWCVSALVSFFLKIFNIHFSLAGNLSFSLFCSTTIRISGAFYFTPVCWKSDKNTLMNSCEVSIGIDGCVIEFSRRRIASEKYSWYWLSWIFCLLAAVGDVDVFKTCLMYWFSFLEICNGWRQCYEVICLFVLGYWTPSTRLFVFGILKTTVLNQHELIKLFDINSC